MNMHYYPIHWTPDKRTEFDRLCVRLHIHPHYGSRLRHIICTPVKVLLINNSGSMNKLMKHSHLNNLIFCHDGIGYRYPISRYDELREFIKVAVPILTFESEITITFVNPPIPGNKQYTFRIQSWEQASELFAYPPKGRATNALATLYQEQCELIKNTTQQGALFLIADDEDTDSTYLCWLIRNRPNPMTFIVNVLLCAAASPASCKEPPGVTCSYMVESRRVQRESLTCIPFSYGDYVVNALLYNLVKKTGQCSVL